MGRGVLWMVWGDGYGDALQRSIASLDRWHPELMYVVRVMPPDSTVLCKSRMYDLSPFEETLFLDADTVVMGNLGYGFERARRHGIACTVSANPWQRRYRKLSATHRDATEYSSGVVFFDKSFTIAQRVFRTWNGFADRDTSTEYFADGGVRVQDHNDQALFTLAMGWDGCNPAVLPQNWNLHPKWQPSFFGPVKILHGPTTSLQQLEAWNEDQSRTDAVIRYAHFAVEGE